MMGGRGCCLPHGQRSYGETKDEIKSTNSEPTLLEDQRKEHEDIVVDEQEAFYHATS